MLMICLTYVLRPVIAPLDQKWLHIHIFRSCQLIIPFISLTLFITYFYDVPWRAHGFGCAWDGEAFGHTPRSFEYIIRPFVRVAVFKVKKMIRNDATPKKEMPPFFPPAILFFFLEGLNGIFVFSLATKQATLFHAES